MWFGGGGWAFYGIFERTATEMTGNRMRERGSDTQQRASGRGSNPGLLKPGPSFSTRDTHIYGCP